MVWYGMERWCLLLVYRTVLDRVLEDCLWYILLLYLCVSGLVFCVWYVMILLGAYGMVMRVLALFYDVLCIGCKVRCSHCVR
jgi:hypothetical protein